MRLTASRLHQPFVWSDRFESKPRKAVRCASDHHVQFAEAGDRETSLNCSGAGCSCIDATNLDSPDAE
jgi:hypothetical protein